MRDSSLTRSANRGTLVVLILLVLLFGAWSLTRPPDAPPGSGTLGRDEFLVLEIGGEQRIETEFYYEGVVTIVVTGTGSMEDGRTRDAFYVYDATKSDARPTRFPLLIDGDPPEFLPAYRDDHVYILRYEIDENDPTPEARTIRFALEQQDGEGEIEISILPGGVQ
jgi:hypothetical protein